MALSPDSRLGPYAITSQLGAGGMGEVYRATDTNLKREVAIKVLPDAVAGDAERLARFQREAEVLAQLNHPNIAQIHGLERSGGTVALVMELVEGPTLAERLDTGSGTRGSESGGLPVDEAIAIAGQIAEAMEAAHEQGIIHRDLKPANIKVRPDGTVKVLDFGLAKAMEPVGAAVTAAHASLSPTITTPAMTQMGMILGTAAYMAPEQAKGRAVDRRADVWAFGCVLYEMLTGRRAFDAEDVSETLAAILMREPDWTALPQATPAPVQRLLRRCLKRDPRQRLQAIGDARLELEDAGEPLPAANLVVPGPAGARARLSRTVPWLLVAALGAALATTMVVWAPWRAPEAGQSVRFDVGLPEGLARDVALSPDGRQLALLMASAEGAEILVRPLDATAPRTVTTISGAPSTGIRGIFWSPDSEFIAYESGGRLMKVAVSGGSPQVIATLPDRRYSGTWGAGDTILLVPVARPRTLLRVPGRGGEPEPVPVRAGADEGAEVLAADWLPDGRHFLAATLNGSVESLNICDLESTCRALPGINPPAIYAAPGHVMFLRGGTMMAQPFDLSRLELAGEAVPVSADLGAIQSLSVSAAGHMAYLARPLPSSRMVWFDRTGREIGRESLTGSLQAPNLARDGQHIAIERSTEEFGADIWVIDLVRGTSTRITDDPSAEIRPVFSPDGASIAFGRGGQIYLKASSGTGSATPLTDGEPTDWALDGRLVFIKGGALWAVPSDGSGTPEQLVDTRGNDRRGRVSPDGKWLAYESDFSGRMEVYLQRFPPTEERVQVSIDGGGSAYWRADGSELYFISARSELMAVTVTPGAPLSIGAPRTLFEAPGSVNNGRFVATPDGQRFLMPILEEGERTRQVGVVLNWAAALAR